MKNLFFICSLFIIIVQHGCSSREEGADDSTIDDILFTEYTTTIKENMAEFSIIDVNTSTTNTDEYEHTTESLSEEYPMSTTEIVTDKTILNVATSEEAIGYTDSSNNIAINKDELQSIVTITENDLTVRPKLNIDSLTTSMSNEDQDFNETMTDNILFTEYITTVKENVTEFSMLDIRSFTTQTDGFEHTAETPTSTTLDEVLLKQYSMSSEKNITVLKNPFRSNVTFEDEIQDFTKNDTLPEADYASKEKTLTELTKINESSAIGEEKRKYKAVIYNETLNKSDVMLTENALTDLTTEYNEKYPTSEEKEEYNGVILNETDSTSNGIVLTELTNVNEKYATFKEEEKVINREFVVSEENGNGFESTVTTNIYENLTKLPKILNNSKPEDINAFTIFMVQKQCAFDKSTGVFNKYPELRVLIEEVEDCLYFAFIKIRAQNPVEIKEALKKFEEKQFHVIKVKQNAGNQDKSRLVLKEHLDCKECLVKGKDIKAPESDIDLKTINNDEKRNTMNDVNDLSLYLALTGSVIALTVLIANVYLCYCRRKQGHSEIPTFNSKPEKFKMTPIPRPSILNGDNVFSQNYLSGRSMSPLRSTEQQAFGKMNYPRNENPGSDFRESGQWIPQRKPAVPKSEISEFPFIENPTFEVW